MDIDNDSPQQLEQGGSGSIEADSRDADRGGSCDPHPEAGSSQQEAVIPSNMFDTSKYLSAVLA